MKVALLLVFLLCTNHVLSAFPIEHWIVIMMENRSFDHMLGFLMRDKNSEINGVTGAETNPYEPSDPKSPVVKISSTASPIDPDGGHSYGETQLEVFGTNTGPFANPPPMNGFVKAAENIEKGWGPQIMSCFNYTSLPVLSTLALEYGMIDMWHASVPSSTETNRAFLQSCSSNGYISNDEYELGVGYPQPTFMAALSDSGYSWKVYFEIFPTALFMRELREYPFHFHSLSQFTEDCKTGNLPTYSFVEPLYFSVPTSGPANDQHPSHNVEDGEKFIKQIYETLRASPAWNKSALIITYDEHGGLYDHVPTPVDGIPNPDGLINNATGFAFDRLGVRVPAVIVSPWVKKGTVVHEPQGPTPTSHFEHCSIAATVRKVLGNVTKLPLNRRDAWAGTFEDMFSLSAPRSDCPTVLPTPPEPSIPHKRNLYDKPLNGLQKGMVETAMHLVGHTAAHSSVDTEQQAGEYVQKCVSSFLEKQKMAKSNIIASLEL